MDNYSLREFKPGGMMSMPMATNVARKTLNARMAVTSEWDKLQLITGIDNQNNQHSKRNGNLMTAYQNKPRIKDMEFQSIGGFGELSYQVTDNHKLVSGLRLDQVKVEAVESNQERKNFTKRFCVLRISIQTMMMARLIWVLAMSNVCRITGSCSVQNQAMVIQIPLRTLILKNFTAGYWLPA